MLGQGEPTTDHPAFVQAEAQVRERVNRLLSIRGSRSVDWFHRELGRITWENCGMARNAGGLKQAIHEVRALREEFDTDVRVPGEGESLNQSLEKAGRVQDFFELAELMCIDALHRQESCGGHFREEHQTPDNEALRDDERFAYVAAWEHTGGVPELHREELEFQYVQPAQRSYK
jgi:succinate dehydrogenase / fumarate reductase flavoprotein subunit